MCMKSVIGMGSSGAWTSVESAHRILDIGTGTVGSFNVGATQFAGCKYCSVGNR